MIKLFFVGDICCDKNDANTILSSDIYKMLKEYDIKSCNFEGPIVDDDMNAIKKAGPLKKQSKNMPEILMCDGFNLINIANNHIMDYGKEALSSTIKAFEKVQTIGAGLSADDAYSTYIYEKENIKIGFFSIAENGFGCIEENNEYGYAWMLNDIVESKIKELREECDYVTINVHAGAEKFKFPLPEIRNLYKKFVDWGANFVIGHHPHIIQGYEKYQDGMIFYSLGNFAFDGAKTKDDRNSYAVSICIENKKIVYECIPMTYSGDFVYLNEEGKVLAELEDISNVLQKSEYNDFVNSFCDKMYDDVYKNYYMLSYGFNVNNFFSKIKTFVKIVFNLRKENNLLLYHNLVIETHLWICKRALKNKIIGR